MALALRTHTSNGTRAVTRAPFSLARELFGWDPFLTTAPISAFSPTFEVKETNDSFIVRADLPGVAEDNLDVSVHSGVLTVSGHRDAEQRSEGDSYALYERQFGSFSRSFSLPEIADGDRIEAKLENGVLTLSIAKKAEAKPRKIALKK